MMQRFPPHWNVLPFTEAVKDATAGNPKLQRQDYLAMGKYPVVDQGQNLFGGYTDDAGMLASVSTPAIVFGDHTRLFKYISEPFCLGADGAKILEPKVDLDKRFLYHYLRSLRIESAGYSRHFKFLKEKVVPVPLIDEQKRIAAILDKADAIRRKRQQAIQLADEFLRAVFLDMFGDPVINPKGWEVLPLIELIDSKRPITYGILKPGNDIENGVPYVRVVDMKDGVVVLNHIRRTTPAIAKQYKRSSLKPGDVLLSIRGHVGRLAMVPDELEGANITQDTARLATNSKCRALYLFSCLQTLSMQKEMARYVRGAAVKGINLGDVKILSIPVPPMSLQEKIERKVQIMTRTIKKYEDSIEALDAQFSALSQKAFMGKL